MKENQAGNLHFLVRRQTFEGWKILPRLINDHEIVFISQGKGYINIEDAIIPVKGGDLILFRPHVKHSLWVEGEPYMLFYGVHFDFPLQASPADFPDIFHVDAPLRLELLFKELYDRHLSKRYLHIWQQNILLEQILCEALMLIREKREPMAIRRIHKILEYIHLDPCRPIAFNTLQEQAGLQKTAFLQAFRQVTDTTPKQYVLNLRLENARDMLKNSDIPIAQVAEQCGFSDPLYFSRYFRKRFFLSPRAYRQKWSKE